MHECPLAQSACETISIFYHGIDAYIKKLRQNYNIKYKRDYIPE